MEKGAAGPLPDRFGHSLRSHRPVVAPFPDFRPEPFGVGFELEAPLAAALHFHFVDLQVDLVVGVPDVSQLFEPAIKVVGLVVEDDLRQFVEIPHASSLCRP